MLVRAHRKSVVSMKPSTAMKIHEIKTFILSGFSWANLSADERPRNREHRHTRKSKAFVVAASF